MTPSNKTKQRSLPVRAGISDSDRETIVRSQSSDYDGHTEFAHLTPAQRLEWLEQAAIFVEMTRHLPPPSFHGH